MSERRDAWAVGFLAFAGFAMVTIGILQALYGFVALLNDEFFVLGRNYTYAFDVTTWGWIHLILGIVVFLAGFALFSGASWARVVATILAMVGIIENFMAIPYFPVWSIILIALNIAVIWAVTVTRNDMS